MNFHVWFRRKGADLTNFKKWIFRNKDRKIFYMLHTGAKPLLYLAGFIAGAAGWGWGFIAIIPAWVIDIAGDVFYWRNFDRSRARCFKCYNEMVCPNCGGSKVEV